MACPPDRPRLAYRIADGRHPLFDGHGAALYGARWSSPGSPVIYASSTYAGAMLEVLVRTGIGRIPQHFHWIEVRIGEDVAVERLRGETQPGWDSDDLAIPRRFGDAWIGEKRTAVLLVPSVVTHLEYNLLINPTHPDFEKIGASDPKPVTWDQRLFAGRLPSGS